MDLTQMRVDVELTTDLPVSVVWDAVADVPRIGEWSPECVRARWLASDGGPRVGARFAGHNQGGEFEWDVVGVVTEATRPEAFAWVVLDDAEDIAAPSSTWRYDLTALPDDRTLVRHGFRHGPGGSGVTMLIEADPGHAEEIVRDRREQLHDHMTTTLRAMLRDLHG